MKGQARIGIPDEATAAVLAGTSSGAFIGWRPFISPYLKGSYHDLRL